MNKSRFTPAKDYKANRLQTGVLQLSARTHLVVDETVLETGQLDTNGTVQSYLVVIRYSHTWWCYGTVIPGGAIVQSYLVMLQYGTVIPGGAMVQSYLVGLACIVQSYLWLCPVW